MTKLLRACMRRYAHNSLFWISVILTLGIAVCVSFSARYTFYDDAMVSAQIVIHAIMISWVVGKEFKEGIFRNKAIVGHSKGSIFLAELISGVGIAFVLYLLYAIIFVAVNFYEVPLLPTSLVMKIFVDYVLLNMSLAAIFVTVSCLLSRQTMVVIVNISFVLLMIIGSQRLYAGLSQPQYYELYETKNSEWIDEDGTIRYREEKIEGSEYLVENPTYVGGIRRYVYETLYKLSPYGHVVEFVYFNMDWHGYDYFMNNPTDGMTGEETWELVISDNVITGETVEKFDANLIYSCILLVIVSGIGYMGFRKKELK